LETNGKSDENKLKVYQIASESGEKFSCRWKIHRNEEKFADEQTFPDDFCD
jgi:hypothetical protein